MNKQTNRQIDRQTDRQTDRHMLVTDEDGGKAGWNREKGRESGLIYHWHQLVQGPSHPTLSLSFCLSVSLHCGLEQTRIET